MLVNNEPPKSDGRSESIASSQDIESLRPMEPPRSAAGIFSLLRNYGRKLYVLVIGS